MTQELKPCPFCGGKATYWEGDWAATDVAAGCNKCEIFLDPASYIDMDTYNDYELDNHHAIAATAWNTRTPEPATLREDGGGDVMEIISDLNTYSLFANSGCVDFTDLAQAMYPIDRHIPAIIAALKTPSDAPEAAPQAPKDDLLEQCVKALRYYAIEENTNIIIKGGEITGLHKNHILYDNGDIAREALAAYDERNGK